MNPNEEVDRGRLATAIERSYRNLEPFRLLARGLAEEYAGSGYGKRGGKHEIIINLMNQTVAAYMMGLVANRPRVLLSSQMPERAAFTKRFEVALNNYLQEIGLEFTLRRWVLDAFFCLGVIKVHMAESGLVELEHNIWMDPGRPFASNVGLDNFVYDTSATNWACVQFAGDMYRIPYSDLSHPMFDQEAVKDLKPSSKTGVQGERVEELTRSEVVDSDELEPMIDLADVWIPRDGKIYTFQVLNRHQFQIQGPPIAVMDWDGVEHGPYHLLGFDDVPENIMPASPASHLSSMARIVNSIFRKQRKQAGLQKTVHAFPPGSEKDADRVRKASDQEFVQVMDPSQIKSIPIGGVDPANQAFAINLMEIYDRMAGNLTAMMGLGSQAPTLGQEQMIQGRVSNKEASMQFRVMDASTRLVRALGYMLWNDKARIIPGRIPIDGAEGYSLDATWTPDDRDGDFFDYQIDIDIFSMAYSPPAQRWAAVSQYVGQMYLPNAQAFMAQGVTLNLQKFTELAAELLNVPQLKQCIQFAAPQPMESEEESPSPTSTTRSYVRKSVSAGPTPQNKASMEAERWMGMNHNSNGHSNGAPA